MKSNREEQDYEKKTLMIGIVSTKKIGNSNNNIFETGAVVEFRAFNKKRVYFLISCFYLFL